MDEQMTPEEYSKIYAQEQTNNSDAIYADTLREERVRNIISQIDPSSLVTEIEHRLRGEKYNPITLGWDPISKSTDPISEKIVEKFVSFLGAVLNQNTTLSNYSIHEINNRMEMIIDFIKDDLTSNAEEYNIEGKYSEMTRIGMIICETCSSVFRRALHGMESKRIFSALRVTESLTPAKQGGVKEALKFW